MTMTAELGTKSIGKLLAQYSIPAVIAMLVNAVYNIVDRIFIGRYVSEGALAGLTITFPIMLIIFAFASLIGAGGATLISIKLGEKDEQGACYVFGNTLTAGAILTFIVTMLLLTNLQSLLSFLGANGEVLEYAVIYMSIILGGFIFQMISFTLSIFVRTEGAPILSMIAMVISALINIILDYFFIREFGWGVAGAAYATIIGQLFGLVVLLIFYFRGKSNLHLKVKDFIPKIKLIGQIMSVGFATFVSTVGISVAMTMLNRSLGEYGGVAAITSMGAINSLYTFFIMPIMGITQAIQPIIGYNHGARNNGRVKKTLRLGIAVGVVFSSIVFLLLQLFTSMFITMFLQPGSTTVDIAINGLRVFILMLPVLSINLIGIAYYQAIAKGRIAMVLGLLRQFLFLVPVLMILPKFWGLNGVWAATPIADALAIFTTIVILSKSSNEEKIRNRNLVQSVTIDSHSVVG